MRALILTTVGVVASAGAAADQPNGSPAGLFVQTGQPATFVQAGCNGCDGSAAAHGPRVGGHLANRAYYNSPLTIGPGCSMPVGCSSWAADRTFLFGSCRQFFGFGGKCDSYLDRIRHNVTTPLGAGGLGADPCHPLFSYHNR
jgi:hypothetical protein